METETFESKYKHLLKKVIFENAGYIIKWNPINEDDYKNAYEELKNEHLKIIKERKKYVFL